eukprot:GSChrysophyteH1.ASY1.ANO1.1720.1 assembled CDS
MDALNDTTLIVLLIAAHGWIEGAAILIAVILVSNISAMNDYSKQSQFAALEATADDDEKCRVLRSGKELEINPRELVVGDIVVMQAGDKIPADCLMVDQNVITSSEASLTGEPEDIKKTGDNFKAVVVGIGINSQWGKIKATLAVEASETPLQEKLNKMTNMIGYIGIFFAILTFLSLTITGFIKAAILSFTIVVVAIPEGLPLAVTIALAYSTKEMYKDMCLIRVLAACETMGNATNICSDKTGTLTENRMTVGELNATAKETITDNTSINRTAVLMEGPGGLKSVGNKTEGALMLMGLDWGFPYEEVRNAKFVEGKDRIFAFNSAKKRSTAVVHMKDGSVRIFVKGASEWVIKDCTHCDEKKNELNDYIGKMADKALRTLVLAHEHPPDAANLVCDCIVGIQDPLRGDVKDAVKTAQEAGVVVRMVTGDNIRTAQAIAKECGILGPIFRKMTPADADAAIKNLAVMARSSPDDKWLLVTRPAEVGGVLLQLLPGYQKEWSASRPNGGEVVGVTGDGTNDAPALKAGDVGLAMGITGTEVAKAIMWGRSVFDNIRKFLQFQLTPLTAVQMLWVNLIMDTLGALALGTEKPTPVLLQRKPYKRNASLVSKPMWRNIAFQSAYQLILLFVLLFASAKWFDCLSCANKDYTHGTIIFNAFIWCQIFNEYTARSILNDVNPFSGLLTNFMFLYVSIFSALCQILIVEFGGRFTSTSPLTLEQHLITMGLGAASIFAFGELCKRYGAEDLPVECPLSTLSSMVAAVTSIDEEDRGGFKATLEQLDLSQNLDPLPVAGGNFDDYCFILGQNEQCASTDSDRAPQSMLLVSDSKSPEKQVTSAGEDIVKRKASTNDLADHVLDAVSFHLLLFPDAQKPDTELRFRISNTRTIAAATGKEFDHTAIVVNTPMQRYTRGRSTRRPEDDKPDQRIYAASRTSNFGGVGSTIVSSVDASGRLETSVAAKSPTIDYESVARQLNRLDLCLLEATAAGVTVLPITERLRAYDHYNCCDYICLRRLRKTTCKDDGTDSETSHDYHGTLDAKTLYRLNCFVVASEQRPYKFVLRNILFAGKAKQQHHNQSDSTGGSIPSLLHHVDAEGWSVFKGVPDTNVAGQGNSSRSQGKKASRGATQDGDTEDAMGEGSDDGMPLDKKSFFCSALTAAALQVLHILPASLNEDYFWPGSFAWGAEMDAILRDIQYGKMNERRVASGNAVEWYSYDREAFIDCRVPEIEAAVEITPGAAIWADSTKGKSMTESLGLEQANADRSDTHLQSVPSRWLHMEEHAMTESRRRAAAANPGETFAPSIF